jgi:hypothetical protein
MENQAKIACSVCLSLIILMAACHPNTYKKIKNPELLQISPPNNLVINPKLISYNDNAINKVLFEGKIYPLEDVIDSETFDLLSNFKEDSLKIVLPYYTEMRLSCYYKDKNYIYFFDQFEDSVLRVMGSANDYYIVGGAYLIVNGTVYCLAQEVKLADINSFRVIHSFQDHSEWEFAFGIDMNYIYEGSHIMTKKSFNQKFWPNPDTLKALYYKQLPD